MPNKLRSKCLHELLWTICGCRMGHRRYDVRLIWGSSRMHISMLVMVGISRPFFQSLKRRS